ncbi:hypothetical protein [Celeribacter arenosi]|uniref:Uncharacterized protein n=1 Tax=Celeribacter arenosi TaxID=792649 RepID=A0ABP7K3N3_9RHOB
MSEDFADKTEELTALLRDRLGVRAGSDFPSKIAKAGRRLPRWARRDARVIVEAMSLQSHPKLAVQVNHTRVDRAHRNLKSHLEAVDPWLRRKGKILDLLALVAFGIFVAVGCALAFMIWRGLI